MTKMLPNENKDHRRLLRELGAERLADALLELAEQHTDVADWIERMVASPKQNVERFKTKLVALKRRRRFINWSEATADAQELCDLLEDLKAGVVDPKTGAELVAAFYKTDGYIFERCDDSNGSIGDVIRHDARDLFIHYAEQCADKAWLSKLFIDVAETDDYGIRDVLVKSASEYLSEPRLRELADQVWKRAEQEAEEYSRRHWIFLVESHARQLKDAPLFEKARRSAWPELSAAACLDIAEVYFDASQAQTALSWLQRIPVGETFKVEERDRLLIEIHEVLGNSEAAIDISWGRFRRSPTEDTLNSLLRLIGEEQRDQVITGETQRILDSKSFSYSDAAFLIKMERIAEAERYLLRWPISSTATYTSLYYRWPRAWKKKGVYCWPACFTERWSILFSVGRKPSPIPTESVI